MKYLLIMTPVLLLFGCKSESPISPQPLKSGEYLGTFALTSNAGTDSAIVIRNAVMFTFSDSNLYTCRGENILNPPTGGGSFRIQQDSIILTDLAGHLAFFDWTLILNGSFYFQSRSDSIIMVQNDFQHKRYRYINLAINIK